MDGHHVLSDSEINAVSGGNACQNAFEWSYAVTGGWMGLIFGPAGGLAGFSTGYSLGSTLAEGICHVP